MRESVCIYAMNTTSSPLYCQNDGKPIRTWNKVGMAVRIAYETRFHREISHSATLSLRDVQLRKRIWWILYISDKMSSLICGRPSAIDEVCVDVSLPLNISSQTAATHVFGDAIIEENIQSTATEHSCDITSIPIFRIAGKMNRDCLLPLEPPAHSLVMQYDRELTDAVHQLPLYIRSSILDTTEEDIQVPHLRRRRSVLQISVHCIRMILHRPHVFRYSVSRSIAVECANHILDLLTLLLEDPSLHIRRWFFTAFHALDPTMVLATLAQWSALDLPTRLEYLTGAEKGLRVLALIAPINKNAAQGVEAMEPILARLREELRDLELESLNQPLMEVSDLIDFPQELTPWFSFDSAEFLSNDSEFTDLLGLISL